MQIIITAVFIDNNRYKLAINGFNHLLVVKQSGFKHFFRLVDISDVECLIFIHIYNL